MKAKILPILFGTLLFGQLQGQISLDEDDFFGINDTVYLAVDHDVSSLTPGGTGMQTWDFSDLAVTNYDTSFVVDPVGTPFYAVFPTSTVAIEQNGGFTYAEHDNTIAEMLGVAIDILANGNVIPVIWDNPQTMFTFPSNYQDNYVDTAFADQTIDPDDLGISIAPFTEIKLKRQSIVSHNFDAYGAVSTPIETLDCLRDFTMSVTVDSFFLFHPLNGWIVAPPTPGVLPENPVVDTVYRYDWYANDKGFALVSMTMDSVNNAPERIDFLADGFLPQEILVNAPSCPGDCNASATAGAVLGQEPYVYQWGSNAGNATTQTVNNLCAGEYFVTITDDFGNTAETSVMIEDPQAMSSSVHVIDTYCDVCEMGSVESNVSGGTAPFSYAWSNGDNTVNLSGLNPGTYDLTVTDGNGCAYETSGTVAVSSCSIDINLNVTQDVDTSGIGTGTATVETLSGTGPYSYYWSNGADTDSISELNEGDISVIVGDNAGCYAEASANIQLLSIKSDLPAYALKLFPNPVQSGNSIRINSHVPVENVKVMNMLGELVHMSWENAKDFEIELAELKSGLYFVTVEMANESETLRLIVR